MIHHAFVFLAYLTLPSNISIYLVGTPILGSNCSVAQGFVFSLDRSCKPFKNSVLSTFVQPYGGSKYLQVYYSILGGEDIAVHDPNNNLRSLQWQAEEIKRVLLDVRVYVPEMQPRCAEMVCQGRRNAHKCNPSSPSAFFV